MTLKQIYEVKNNQLVITLPPGFKNKKKVLVIVDDSVDVISDKMATMKAAATDPLFLADVQEIKEDFDAADNENHED